MERADLITRTGNVGGVGIYVSRRLLEAGFSGKIIRVDMIERGQELLIHISAAGCPYDNAMAERVDGILRSECYLDRIFGSISQARSAVQEAVAIYTKTVHT